MNIRAKATTLSAIFILSGLCMVGKTFAKSNNPFQQPSGITFSARSIMRPTPSAEPLTSEKQLDLKKQKLDLLYQKGKLESERQQLERESQNIKDELKTIFRELERGQDFPNVCETWQKKLDNCLEKRRIYREKLQSLRDNYREWRKRKNEFVEEVKRYRVNI